VNKRGGAGWLSSLMHLSGQSRVIKFLPHSMGPEISIVGLLCNVHKTSMHL
jgi:hypothetical protein